MQNDNKLGNFAKSTASFGVAAAKVFSGTATPRDWKVFLKYAIPVALGGFFFSIIMFVLILGIVFAVPMMAKEKVENLNFWEKFGNFMSGNGWNDSETAFFKIIEKSKLSCSNSSLVTSTIMYYQISNNGDMDFAEEPNDDPENPDDMYEGTDYGKLLPDLKRLVKKMKKGEEKYEEYVKNTFLEKDPYNKLLDGYSDREKRKNDVYEEIKSIAQTIPCQNNLNNGGGFCSYNVNGVTASDLKVRLLQCNAPYNPIPDEKLIDFETYITGVVSQEVGGSSFETLKAQAVAARSYALTRSQVVGAGIGKIEQIDGEWVISLRACTADQAFCHPDRGCWSNAVGGEMNFAADGTIHSGYDATKSWNRKELPADSQVRRAVKETEGIVALDANGNIVYTGFMDTDQKAWEASVKSGADYKAALKKHYPSIDSFAANCTSPGGGQIRFPLPEGTYTVTSRFGTRSAPTAGAGTNHKGIDLAAPTGTPIYAIAPATVLYSQVMSGYGNVVILGHDTDSDGKYNYITVYGHQSERMVEAGQKIPGGYQIGKVGNTGISTGPHLHFEIREGSEFSSAIPKDPEPYLNDIKAGTSIFNKMIQIKEKYYNQGDYANVAYCPGTNETVQTSGCLPTSFAMIVAYLSDSSITPADIANNICTKFPSYRVDGSGTISGILDNQSFLSQYNIHSKHVTSDYENTIKTSLSMNKPIIVNVRGGIFNPSGCGHYFVLIGLGSNGKVRILDPGSRQKTNVGEYSISDITSNISNGIWIFE